MPAERIPITELKQKLESKASPVVVDVRETSEVRNGGAIPGAIHIPMGQLEKRKGELPRNSEIVFYCGGGGRASRAAEAFLKAGHKRVHYCGLRDWKKEGLPTVSLEEMKKI